MTKVLLSKVMWIGRATVFLLGLAVILALVFGVASTALGANGKPFILGKAANTATRVTGLIGKVATGSALVVQNPSGGSALDLQVNGGQAPLKVNPEAGTATNLSADTLDGKDSTQFASAYKRTVVVSPAGSATQNGAALENALAGITDASQSNPYLLKIEPGIYDMGNSNTLQMKEWVDIEGSGEGVTRITASGTPGNTGTIAGASNSELRFLTAENTGGSQYAIAIWNPHTSGSTTRITRVSAIVSGGSAQNIGVVNDSSVTMTDVRVMASGGPSNIGVVNNISSPTLTNVTARALGGEDNTGVRNSNSSPVIHQSTLEARGGSFANYALSSGNGGTIRVSNPRLVATGPNNTIDSNSLNGTTTTRVAASQLDGGPASGTVTCAGVYDESYAFFANTCP